MGRNDDLVPEGLGRPDIPELFSGGCQMCLHLRALLPTQCDLSSRWAYKLVLQVMLGIGIQSDKGPCGYHS